MNKKIAFLTLASLVVTAGAALAETKVSDHIQYDKKLIQNDYKKGAINQSEANALDKRVDKIQSEERWLKHHHKLDHKKEEQMNGQLRHDNLILKHDAH